MKKLQGIITARVPWLARLLDSIWLFPIILTVILCTLTALRINGSSLGVYHNTFQGSSEQDEARLFGSPKDIRSDEWLVNTQMMIAQDNNDYQTINDNIGEGQNMSVVLDVPYAEWSQIFRPQNLVFFVLPFDNAFAFKWWLLAYLLVLSAYFFVLALLPGRRLLAVGIAISVLFGGMVQWWYQTITIAPLYYSLFIATAVIHALRARRLRYTVAWSVLIAYLAACFALVLYPPFQIVCALGLAAFLLGFGVQHFRLHAETTKRFVAKLGLLAAGCVVGGLITLTFVLTRADVVRTITDTAYPGERIVQSGGFDAAHIFSGFLGFPYSSLTRAEHYQILDNAVLNQSEGSNFILLVPFLLLPSLFIIIRDKRHKRRADWPLILVNIAFLFLVAWMLVPGLDFIGKLMLLDKVQHFRTLLGLGLLNVLQLVLIIRRLNDFTGRYTQHGMIIGYALIVLGVQLWLGLFVLERSPGYITPFEAVMLSLPVPIIIYLLLRKHVTLAIAGLAAFSIFTTALVNPLYRGTETVSKTPLLQAIQRIDRDDTGTWAAEAIPLENFPAAAGVTSITGVYAYPQLDLWEDIAPYNEDIYNRYAHVNINFDRNPAVTMPTALSLPSPDHFDIMSEPCSEYIRSHIKYLLTFSELSGECIQQADVVTYSKQPVYIYKVR